MRVIDGQKLSAPQILAHLRRRCPEAQATLSAYKGEVSVKVISGTEWVVPLADLRDTWVLDELVAEIITHRNNAAMPSDNEAPFCSQLPGAAK